MKINEIPQLSKLSIPEKILLVEDLWDSITASETEIPIPKSHQTELDARNDRIPGKLLTLEELQESIDSRK